MRSKLVSLAICAMMIITVLIIEIPINTTAQVTEEWVARYDGPGNSNDFACDLALDSSGNIYVAGFSQGSGSEYDYATIKYDSSGNQQWVKRYNGPGNYYDVCKDLTVDPVGNVYVTGYSYGSTDFDYATIKYDTNGNQLWIARYDGPAHDEDWATDITLDSSGNVLVTGHSISSGTYVDYATIKYDTNGNQLWVARYNGPKNLTDEARCITTDSSDNVYVSGMSIGIGTEWDFATIKYDPNGNELWVSRYNGPGNRQDGGYDITVDSSGYVYVTGESYSGPQSSGGTYLDFATIKYDPSGNELWVSRYNGPGNFRDWPVAIQVDTSGNVYVTGDSDGIGTYSDYATIKYDFNGNELWISRYNGPGNVADDPEDMDIDSAGNVYVTGKTGISRGSSGWTYEYATIKYDTNGNQKWIETYNGPGNHWDFARAIEIGPSNDVFVTGRSMGIGTTDDYATIKYSQGPPNQPPFADAGPDRNFDMPPIITTTFVSFNGSGSYDPDGTIVDYIWDFGDGNSAHGVTALHAYTAPGNYTVTLTVVDDGGATSTDTAIISMIMVPVGTIRTDKYYYNLSEPVTIYTWGVTPLPALGDHWYIIDDENGNSIVNNSQIIRGGALQHVSDPYVEIWDQKYFGVPNAGTQVPPGKYYVWFGGGRKIYGPATFEIVSSGNPPVADAGPDQTVNEGDVVEFDGSNSRGGGQSQIPDAVALWHMNEGSGNVIYDGTGNNHDGNLYGPSWTSDGQFGNALSFDGVDDYVDVGSNNIYGNGSAITVEAWFKINKLDSPEIYILGSRADWPSPNIGGFYFLVRDNGRLDFYLYFEPTWRNAVSQISDIQIGKWYQIVGVYDGSIKLYLNGSLEESFPWPGGFDTSTSNVFLGGVPKIRNFNGTIDEVVIWDRALSAQEILDCYNCGKEHFTCGGATSIVSYEWDFESDGIYDYQETPTFAPDGTYDGKTTHVYGDNGIYTATLRVTDDQNLTDTDTCNITVLNVNPTVTIESVSMDVEIGLRVAGRKYNDVGMTLYEDDIPIGHVSIERLPGSPDEQMAWIPLNVDFSKSYSATVTYAPEDPPNKGANPVWIYLKSQNGSIKKIHHKFNVQQSMKRDSIHWNHVEPWEVDLNAHFTGLPFEVVSHVTDPGSDDEYLTYAYGSQIVNVTYLNNPPNPDPYPSPEVNPVDIYDTTFLLYEGPGTIALTVTDDDDGIGCQTVTV